VFELKCQNKNKGLMKLLYRYELQKSEKMVLGHSEAEFDAPNLAKDDVVSDRRIVHYLTNTKKRRTDILSTPRHLLLVLNTTLYVE